VTNFGRGFKAAGDEFLETKRGFCWEWAPSQKPLSDFTQLSHFGRYKEILDPIFQEFARFIFLKNLMDNS
jgi:hypothetical protein